jgi:NarL family two-component system response regulator LiaR
MSTNIPKSITILLADDHPTTRAGIRATLAQSPDLKIIGEAQNGIETQQMVAELRPRILLLDLRMPHLAPAKLEQWVRENYPETITLILTQHDRDTYLTKMMDAGVAGYLSKETSAEQLIGGIRRAAKGEILFDAVQLTRANHWRKAVGEKLKQLTDQEYKVLELLAKGMDSQSIATALGIGTKTVSFHITNLLSKLQLKSRQEATVWALKHLSDDLE